MYLVSTYPLVLVPSDMRLKAFFGGFRAMVSLESRCRTMMAPDLRDQTVQELWDQDEGDGTSGDQSRG